MPLRPTIDIPISVTVEGPPAPYFRGGVLYVTAGTAAARRLAELAESGQEIVALEPGQDAVDPLENRGSFPGPPPL